jgi:hypothetical protein
MVDYDKEDNLSDVELLNAATPERSLSRLWAMRTGSRYQKEMTELAAERSGNARSFMLFHDQDPRAKHRAEEERRRALLAYEYSMQEIRDHADRILLRIDEQQHEIEKRRRELEGRALHLHDGRRFWIDGGQFRDDSGAILQGRDHEEAANLASAHPDAPTWTERENIRAAAEDIKRIKEKVLAERERAGEGDPAAAQDRLTGYEKELQAQMEQRRSQMASSAVDYGDPDYREMLSSQPAFNEAANADAPVRRADKKETETASADNKRPLRTPGQGAPKPC